MKLFEKLLNIQKKIIPKNENLLKGIYLFTMVSLLLYSLNVIFIISALCFVLYSVIFNKYPSIDKLEHYYMGIIYFLIVGVPLVYGCNLPLIWCIVPSVVFGATKELIDTLGYGNPEEMDFIKTIQFSLLFYLIHL